MVSKYQWHKAWTRLSDGRLRHESGLEFEHDDVLGWHTCKNTLDVFQTAELTRGVPLHDIVHRLMRLAKEAGMWSSDPRNVQ